MQSSSPLDFDPDSGSDLEPDAPYHAYDDGARSADEDERSIVWGDANSEVGEGPYDYGLGEEESVYGDEDASGDECEYGDPAW